MARKAPQLAKLTRPRLHKTVARERLFAKLDQHPELFATPASENLVSSPPVPHANVRGADFFRSAITTNLTSTGEIEPCSSNPPSIH